jgi:DNA-binding transcriptional LysR family regulator
MARSRCVAAIWNWLPAFRVVAEYESIHKAAAVMNVSASALSRTVRLLEDALGEALFVRTPVGLGLTSYGAEVLHGTRDALRRMDDVLARASSATACATRPLVVGASGGALPFLVARAVGRTSRALPKARFRVTALDDADATTELLRGNTDVAIVEEPSVLPEITHEVLGAIAFALFAAPGAGDDAAVVALDGLTVDRARVAMFAPTVDLVLHIAEEGSLLALLPCGLAPSTFRRVAKSDASIAVHALTRRPLDASCAPEETRALLDTVRALLRETVTS